MNDGERRGPGSTLNLPHPHGELGVGSPGQPELGISQSLDITLGAGGGKEVGLILVPVLGSVTPLEPLALGPHLVFSRRVNSCLIATLSPAPGAALGRPQCPFQRATPYLRVRGQADPGGCSCTHKLLREAAASHPEGGPGYHPPAGAPVRAQPLLLPAAGPGGIGGLCR